MAVRNCTHSFSEQRAFLALRVETRSWRTVVGGREGVDKDGSRGSRCSSGLALWDDGQRGSHAEIGRWGPSPTTGFRLEPAIIGLAGEMENVRPAGGLLFFGERDDVVGRLDSVIVWEMKELG